MPQHKAFKHWGTAAMRFLIITALMAGAVYADPSEHGLSLEPLDPPGLLGGQLPPDLPIDLTLDDGSAESVFGIGGGTARQFLWLNRFENPGNFILEEIWVLFPNGMDVPDGGSVQLAVFLDPDGDPTNGADLIATYDEVIQAVDGVTFSVYPIAPLEIDEGDILIGAVNRYFTTGSDPPPTFPAAVDTTASFDRSFFALWAGDPPNPPDLASATVIDVLDGVAAGNFMIRGFGSDGPVLDIPAAGDTGLLVLASLLAAFGVWRLARRG